MAKQMKNFFYLLMTLFVVALISACGGGGNNSDTTGEIGNEEESVNNLPMVCPTIMDINPGMNIKYKSQNVHGGRGPSFIMGCQWNAKQYWPISTYLATFPIYSAKGNEIGRFVVFDPGNRPYGNRSYSGLPGGWPPDSQTLLNDALADGSTEIYVNVHDNICFRVNNPTVDQGTITPIWGTGRC